MYKVTPLLLCSVTRVAILVTQCITSTNHSDLIICLAINANQKFHKIEYWLQSYKCEQKNLLEVFVRKNVSHCKRGKFIVGSKINFGSRMFWIEGKILWGRSPVLKIMISKKFIARTKCDKNMQEAVMEILIQYEAVQMVVMVQNYFNMVNFDNILWQNGISKSKLLKISTEQRMLCILNVIFMLWVNFVSLKIFCMKMLFGKNNKTKLEAFFNQERQED